MSLTPAHHGGAPAGILSTGGLQPACEAADRCDMSLTPAEHGGEPHGAGPQLVPVPALVDTWRPNAAGPDAARQPADVDPVRALRRAEEQLQALLQNSADFVL